MKISCHHCAINTHSSTKHAVLIFSPSTLVSPVSIIPQLLNTHSFIYHKPCNFILTVHQFPCQYHSRNPPYTFIKLPHTLQIISPNTSFSPVSIIPPSLHNPSLIYHKHCKFFLPVIQFLPSVTCTIPLYKFIYLQHTL